MNRISMFAISFLLSVGSPAPGIGQAGSPVQIAVRTDATSFKSGAEIKLWITLTNVSDRPIDIYTGSGANGGHAEADDAIYLRDTAGRPIARIDGRTVVRSDGKAVKMRTGSPSRRGVTLQPGGQFQDYALLDRLFDLSSPGTYFVNVAQDLRLDHTSPVPALTTAISNTIQISVVDSAAGQ